MTDPTSRQRGRPKKDKTVTLKKNLWSKVPDLGSTPRHTDCLTVSRNVTLTLTKLDNTSKCSVCDLFSTCKKWKHNCRPSGMSIMRVKTDSHMKHLRKTAVQSVGLNKLLDRATCTQQNLAVSFLSPEDGRHSVSETRCFLLI
jgi:hypothetical protein